jgi:Domain of unknown function (DUF6438)
MGPDHNRGETPLQSRSRLQSLNEAAFSLNLATAIGYALLMCVYTHDLDYYLLRAAIRVDDFLHFPQTHAVTTEALRRQSQNTWSQFAGTELTILVSMFAAMIVVLLFLRISPNAWYRVIMGNRCSGFFALFGLPLGYLCTLFWHADSDMVVQREFTRLFWLLVAVDVLCVAILFLIFRVRPLSTWTIGILLVFHCAFWLTSMSPPLSLFAGALSPSLVAFPFSVAIWLRHLKTTQGTAATTGHMRQVGKWTVASAVVSGAVVLVIWYPGRAYSLAHPRNTGSVSIEMSRGPCFGSCPIYSLTLQGDGLVEYRGIRFVRVKEKQSTRIGSEQLMQVLSDLDRMHFFTVEDRAFQWGFDSPSVSISVSVDGRQKRVTTDGVYVAGWNGGPKARILQIAHEIDTIVGSKQWVQCNGLCRN